MKLIPPLTPESMFQLTECMFELMKVCRRRWIIGLRRIGFQEILLKVEFGGILQMLVEKVGNLPTFILFCNTNHTKGAASYRNLHYEDYPRIIIDSLRA